MSICYSNFYDRLRQPDLQPFVRANRSAGVLGKKRSHSLEQWVVANVTEHTDPALVPLASLKAMGTHAMVYLAERTVSGVVRRPDLYYVRHPDPAVVKETEEWLWPLLPVLLGVAAHAYAYGSVPVVFNWGTENLTLQTPTSSGKIRKRTLRDHLHWVSAHEIWPGDVEVEVEGDELIALEHQGLRYMADRAHVFRWDPEFGSWIGQGARRRAWRDYAASLSVEILHAQYLERSVDAPRVGYAPPGAQKVDGADVQNLDHMTSLILSLKGSGSLTLPSTRDSSGNRRYEVDVMNLPDRKETWHRALNRYDAGILRAYLVPPSLGGLEDLAASGAKVLDGMLREFIQDLAQFAADNLTHLVGIVHSMNHDPAKTPPPEIMAYEVPAAVRKLYLEVLRLVGASQHGASPAEWVDVPALLDQLGVPLRITPATGKAEGVGQPGRPRDMTGGREERREDARTDEGEDATGFPDGGGR